MAICDVDGVIHEAYTMNDGFGDPRYLIAFCEFIMQLRNLRHAAPRRWSLTGEVEVPITCVDCIAMERT